MIFHSLPNNNEKLFFDLMWRHSCLNRTYYLFLTSLPQLIWRLQRQQKSRQVFVTTGWYGRSLISSALKHAQELFWSRCLAFFLIRNNTLHRANLLKEPAKDKPTTRKAKYSFLTNSCLKLLLAVNEEAYMIKNLSSAWQGEAIMYCVEYLKPRVMTDSDEKMIFITITLLWKCLKSITPDNLLQKYDAIDESVIAVKMATFYQCYLRMSENKKKKQHVMLFSFT